jgi:preprotein translocase subunit SecD
MRARNIRISILILLILGVALAALGFRDVNVDLPGFPAVERGGNGPMGLKLGLDLQGGGHLVYQADTGTRLDVIISTNPREPSAVEVAESAQGTSEDASEDAPATSDETGAAPEGAAEDGPASQDAEEPGAQNAPDAQPESRVVTIEQLTQTLETALLTEFLVTESSLNSFRIRSEPLDDLGIQELRDALEAEYGDLLSFEVTQIEEPTSDQMEGVLDIINKRVNRFGTEEPIIQQFGDDRVIIQLPGATGSLTRVQFAEPVEDDQVLAGLEAALASSGVENPNILWLSDREVQIRSATLSRDARQNLSNVLEAQIGAISQFSVTSGIDDAKELIGQTARLEFKERTCSDPGCITFTDAEIGLTGDNLARADVSADPSGVGWAINIQFDGRGAEVFSELTRRLFQRQDTGRIAVFLDDDELIAPVARAWIRDGRSQITGNFTREEARTIAIQLESGRLPVPLELIQERDVEALLGSESLRNSLLAGFVGLGIVMLFMLAYYRMAGVVASLALVFYAVALLALFKMIPVTLTLSHIGGFILSIGMAVDANILIFERMKEEMRIGRTLASSMEVGFSRAWPAIRDSNVSTMITCLVLLWFGDRLGGGLVTGFAISLFLGVAVSMFTAVVVSRNLLQLTGLIGMAHRISLYTPEKIRRTGPVAQGGG